LFGIRFDDTTVGGQGQTRLFLKSYAMSRLMPSDTVVVSGELHKSVVLRGFKDWTQIISTFVIGAAAATVLFS